MKKSILYLLSLLLLTHCTPKEKVNNGTDEYHNKCKTLVLEEGVKDQEYIFKVIGKAVDEMSVTYLGSINTKKGKVLKVLNVTNFTGLTEDAKKANSSVYLYDGFINEIGKYYVGGINSLPSKVTNGSLLFSYNNESCNESTAINFVDSIPKQIFVRCTKDGGDLYSFENTNNKGR